MFTCTNCGGNVKFDIASQQLSCEYCNQHYDPYSFEDKTSDAVEEKDFEVTVFTCPQCGGEILSTDDAIAGFCSFCGASTVLYSRIQKEHRPISIIPFKKTKEDCKNAYASLLKKAIFAPKELKDPTSIDGFRGIYMPYWAFDIKDEGHVSLEGKTSHRSGDYIVTDHYRLNCNVDAEYSGISYDASSSFSDNISEELAPYDIKEAVDFTPAFLSGFYADTADVDSSVYQADAEQVVNTEIKNAVIHQSAFSKYEINTPMSDNLPGVKAKTDSVEYTMFPVWFMSYRKNDRIAYATVNGQTGKVVVDLPVDIFKYILGSLLLAIPFFIGYNMFLTLVPKTLMIIASVLAVITLIIYFHQVDAIKHRESEDLDRGKMSKNKTSADSVQLPKGSRSAAVVFVVIGLIGNIGIYFLNPISDIYYYGGCVFSLLAIMLSFIGIIRAYNILSTRKLPQFNKQGGDDRA